LRSLSSARRPLVLLLALASLLRLVLVVQGGQLYWPDERRYTQVLDILDLHRGHVLDIIKALVSTQEHLGFALLSAIPASIQLATGHALSRTGEGVMLLPGILLSQMSVMNIALVYAVARRAGRDRAEALLAAALMASATTMFYYARHLLPYDSAMLLALVALWCGIGTSPRDSFACGMAASAAFLVYNGYWLTAAVVLLLHVVQDGRMARSAVPRALYAAIGFAALPAVIVVIELATGAPLLISGMRRFAGTVTDGYAPEGFSVPWVYFWYAEHGLLLVWLLSALFVALGGSAWNEARRRTAMKWIGAAVVIYFGLGVTSAMLHWFVVMGRQSRQLVPFFSLATAAAIAEVWERRRWSRAVVAACFVLLVLQVGWNFRQPLEQRFPRDVIAEVRSKYGDVDFENTIEGPPDPQEHVASRWVLLNTEHLYHPRAPKPPLPSSAVEVVRYRHPLQFLPYQYEGFAPMERQLLRANDIAMRLVDVDGLADHLP
jgi:hypothetical protein